MAIQHADRQPPRLIPLDRVRTCAVVKEVEAFTGTWTLGAPPDPRNGRHLPLALPVEQQSWWVALGYLRRRQITAEPLDQLDTLAAARQGERRQQPKRQNNDRFSNFILLLHLKLLCREKRHRHFIHRMPVSFRARD